MDRAIDHDLWRVHGAIAANLGVGALARRMCGLGERVPPTEIVPIVDRQAHRDERRIIGKLSEKLVCRGARRAALAGEELDHPADIAGSYGRGRGDHCAHHRHRDATTSLAHQSYPLSSPVRTT